MGLSRIQLAAALIEYDNDPDSPIPQPSTRSHRDSAMFLPYQQAQQEARRRQILSQPPPVLPSPVESTFASHSASKRGSAQRPESQSWRRRLVSDLDLGAPNAAPQYERDIGQREGGPSVGTGEEEDLAEVDVSRWGPPSHLIADAPRPPTTRRVTVSQPVPEPIMSPTYGRTKSIHVADVIENVGQNQHEQYQQQRRVHERTVSMGNNLGRLQSSESHMTDRYGADRALAKAERVRQLVERPHTVMGWQGGDSGRRELRNRRISDPIMVPLPSSPMPTTVTGSRPLSSLSRTFSPNLESEIIEEGLDEPNPFALPAPPPELGSRFDPKVLDAQRRSSAGSVLDFEAPSRPSSRTSEFQMPRGSTDVSYLDPASPAPSPARTPRIYQDIPTPAEYGRPLMPPRYSTSAIHGVNRQSLLQPKVLVMPSTLAGSQSFHRVEPNVPEGFVRGEKPLPAEAKTTGRRPGIPLSLSQKTFRSSLIVGGKREEQEYWLGGTEIEGEIGVQRRELDEGALEKKPGKLYGRSLMDELEARKAALRGRQRVFTGDSRPAMMNRSSALIDPSALSLESGTFSISSGSAVPPRPTTYHPESLEPLLHEGSGGDVPASEDLLRSEARVAEERITKSRSVFGVDQLWERELAKLKAIQDEESTRNREEEARILLAEQKGKKKGKKDRAKSRAVDAPQETETKDQRPIQEALGISPIRRAGSLPPVLDYAPEQVQQQVTDDPEQPQQYLNGNERLRAGDRKDDLADFRPEGEPINVIEEIAQSSDESDEDLPLSKLAPAARSIARGVAPSQASTSKLESGVEPESDSDEDVPLSKLTLKWPSGSARSQGQKDRRLDSLGLSLPTPSDMTDEAEGEDEDDLPLAVRQARAKGLKPITKAEIIEDDLPLGYKHAEKAQKQMAERGAGDWLGSNTVFSFAPGGGKSPAMVMSPAVGQMASANPAVWGIPPHMIVYMGMGGMGMSYPGTGHPSMSMPNFHQAVYMPGVEPGQGGVAYGHHGFMSGPMPALPPSPGKNIDSWRQDVALAPVPTGGTGSGSGSSAR
ncbi:hypothetical protein IAR55_000045 [Kwoniella newhampshirensis]|uniref:Uncharacterized protein n=1 Tax=Kwoniella newhampshirensis TaxID=1651941 RepID=A0AAW0Z5L8_9TREE